MLGICIQSKRVKDSKSNDGKELSITLDCALKYFVIFGEVPNGWSSEFPNVINRGLMRYPVSYSYHYCKD